MYSLCKMTLFDSRRQLDFVSMGMNIGAVSRCILDALNNCRDSTARDFYASLLQIIYDETDFTVSIWGIMFLCFIVCVALSFFVCVLRKGKSTESTKSTKHTDTTD